MTETFAALFLAHILADFVFQNGRIARGKQVRSPLPLAAHIAIVYITAALATGYIWNPYIAALAAAHLIIDVTKSMLPKARLWPFLADQAAHIVSLAVITIAAPDLWQSGYWMGLGQSLDWAPPLMALMAGAIAVTRAGGFAVGILLRQMTKAAPDAELPTGGQAIGVVERGLIFLLVLLGLPAGIGLLIAAKSVFRFQSLRAARANGTGTYIIVGTLASFGWAGLVSWGTLALLGQLPPLPLPLSLPLSLPLLHG